MTAATEKQREIVRQRAQMEADFGTAAMPEKARDLIWLKAWEDGHSSGFGAVREHYEDIADIAKAVSERFVALERACGAAALAMGADALAVGVPLDTLHKHSAARLALEAMGVDLSVPLDFIRFRNEYMARFKPGAGGK